MPSSSFLLITVLISPVVVLAAFTVEPSGGADPLPSAADTSSGLSWKNFESFFRPSPHSEEHEKHWPWPSRQSPPAPSAPPPPPLPHGICVSEELHVLVDCADDAAYFKARDNV